MNKAKLKSYAPQARRNFIQAMTDRAAFYGLKETLTSLVTVQGDVAVIEGRSFPASVAKKRKTLEERIRKDGFQQTMEAVAYTWFNRLVAIRFMELHGYFDHGYRVLSHPEGKPTPEIVEHAEHIDLPGLKKDVVIDLKLGVNKEDELYRLLLTAQCNALHSAMPFLFEKIDDETELLLPDNLLNSDSLIRKLVSEIDEEDWQEVEIIGWLYQFYISEKKDEVIGKVVASEDIPAATQLFTPNWIVKYLVQNTLGRQWMEHHPDSPLKGKMEYYIEPAEQTPEVQAQLQEIIRKRAAANRNLSADSPQPTADISLNPENLTLLDPACGSGHILVEAYDLFKAIYQERGEDRRKIPSLILSKNLFGLEIDDRAAQLAAFALMMKARADDRRIFESDAKPNIVCFVESTGMDAADITHALNSPILKEKLPPPTHLFEEIQEEKDGLFLKKHLSEKGHVSQADIATLLELFEHAKTFGSLIQIPPKLADKLSEIEKRLDDVLKFGGLELRPVQVIKPILQQAKLLARQYDAVVANPPYMGSRLMTPEIKRFARTAYPDSKSDLFAMCAERFVLFLDDTRDGMLGLMTPFTWMFIQSYEHLRGRFLSQGTITSLIRPEYHSFFESAFVPICVYVFRRAPLPDFKGTFIDLEDFAGEDMQPIKAREAIHSKNCSWKFLSSAVDFLSIPGHPIAYWVSEKVKSLFSKFETLGTIAQPRKGNSTSDNDRFLRQWHELSINNIGFGLSRPIRGCRWIPYNKGGGFRRWYGLNSFVIDWLDEGAAIRAIPTAVIANESLFFNPGLTWSTITVSHFSVRLFDQGFIFDNGGCCVFSSSGIRLYLLGLLNSKVFEHVLEKINPTLNYQSGDVAKFPTLIDKMIQSDIEAVSQDCVLISKLDWDSFETSWDFSRPHLLSFSGSDDTSTIAMSFEGMAADSESRIARLSSLEEKNNRLLAVSYGLADEISPGVDIDQITLHRPDREEDIKRLISYAIGCMMGRYSLDKPGLILANQGEMQADYLRLVSTKFEPIDPERAIREPESVALDTSKEISCFACGKVETLDRARFVIAGEADGESVHGRPLIYCQDCCNTDRASYVTFSQPLKSFSISQAVERNWCDPESLNTFLETATCFGHRIPLQKEEVQFLCDDDGIVPLLETDWGIRDDATHRFEQFIGVAWPKVHLEENLKFVADSLSPTKGEQPRETIRRYLVTGFYKHHLSMYKKRPIYWLFSSGKQRAFQCLVYLHRYHAGTLARMRTEYVIPLQGQMAARIEQLEGDKNKANSTSHRNKLQKEQDKLKKQQAELLTFEEKLKHAADQKITLDLDDGVKANYAKFGDLLAESKAITGGKGDE